MDLQEQTKQCTLCVTRMYSALPKHTEAQVLGRQVRCSCGRQLTSILTKANPTIRENLVEL